MSASPSRIRRLPVAFIGIWLAVTLPLIACLLWPDPRVYQDDPARLLEEAVRIDDLVHPPDTPADRPVLVSAEAAIAAMARDPEGISQGAWLALSRRVETYAWVETEIPENELPKATLKRSDRYRYSLAWQENPKPWRELQNWRGHLYSLPPIASEDFYASGISLGRLVLDLETAALLDWQDIDLPVLEVMKSLPRDQRYVYRDPRSMDNPEAGSYRLHYRAIPIDARKPLLTVLGARDFNRLVPFRTVSGQDVLLVSTKTPDELRMALGEKWVPLSTQRLLVVSFLVLGLMSAVFSSFLFFVVIRKP